MKTLAIVINFHAAHWTVKAVHSLLQSEHTGSLQIVVVDNSCDSSEAGRLKKLLPGNVVLCVNPENTGFGRACNQVFEAYDSDFVLLLNPDAVLLPGCLLNLQKALMQSGKIGAAGPQIFWDPELQYYLPPSYPDLFLWTQPLFSHFNSRFLGDCWRFFSLKVWKAAHPLSVLNLCGGLVLIRRSAAIRAGGLFDPAFFLYYEDTDLFVRIRQAGYRLQVIPDAKAVHYYDQCDQKNWKTKRQLMAASHAVYIRKHCKGWKKIVDGIVKACIARRRRVASTENVPCYRTSFSVEVPKHLQKGWLFEWSPNPDFIPSIGKFGKGPELIFRDPLLKLLAPGRYYGRLGDCRSFGVSYQFMTWIIDESENGNRDA